MTDGKPSTDPRSIVLAFGAVSLLVGAAVAQFEPLALAWAAGGTALVISTTAWIFSDQRGRSWFWYFMGTVVILHGVALCTVPWPLHREPTKADVLIAGGSDLILTFAVGSLVGYLARKIGKKPSAA
jgi:hypothetical protein